MIRFAKLAVILVAMTATSAYAAAPGAVDSACYALGACCGMACC